MTRIALIVLLVAANIFATQLIRGDNRQGVWFYNEPKEVLQQEDNKTKKNAIASIPKSDEELDQLSADELSELLENVKKEAVASGKKEDVKAYVKLQNYMTGKSEKFQQAWQEVILEDSSLDLAAPMAKGNFARKAVTSEENRLRDELIAKNINRIQLVMFYRSDEPERTEAQTKIYHFLTNDFPLQINFVDVKREPKYIDNLNITALPDNWMIYRDNSGKRSWYRVKAGLAAKDEILDGILFIFDRYINKKNKEESQ